VFDVMAEKKENLNFGKSFKGCDSTNIWHTLMVLVDQEELI
jgi:hypothetical protein